MSPDQERGLECPAAVSFIPGTAGCWSVGLYDPGSQLIQVTFLLLASRLTDGRDVPLSCAFPSVLESLFLVEN